MASAETHPETRGRSEIMKRKLSVLALFGVGMLPAQTADIAFESAADFLKLPAGMNLGEAAGVATNSKGHIFVYTRTGEQATAGASRIFTHGGSRLFEF